MMHHVKVWKGTTCTGETPFFEEYNASNKCINLRDGHSVYYDCNTAHLPAELSAGAKYSTRETAWVVVLALITLFLQGAFVHV